jgi:hypothetical protein
MLLSEYEMSGSRQNLHIARLMTAITCSILLFASPIAGWAQDFFSKHYYCIVRHEGLGPRCQTCWTYTGGEGGRVSCGYVYGPGTVRYGSCDEKRNRPPC